MTKNTKSTNGISQMSNSGNYKEMQDVFKLIYFKKLPIKKCLIKLRDRVLIDDSVLKKFWFNKQAPQKVLIKLSFGVSKYTN